MTLPSNVRFFVADTETTGVEKHDKVVEVGWIEIDENFSEVERVESLIDPQMFISPESSGVHGLVNADVENSPTIEEFFTEGAEGCYGRVVTDPVVLIGHRISFDHGHLKPYFQNVVQELCTLRWSRRLYPDLGNHQLSTMIYAVNLPRSIGAHRVMADVLSALHLTRHVCERTGMNLRELAQASAAPMLIPRMPMGKHKGELVEDVPSSYLRWMQGNMDLDEDMAHSVETALVNKKNKK